MKRNYVAANFRLTLSKREAMHDTCKKFGIRAVPAMRTFLLMEAERILAEEDINDPPVMFNMHFTPEEKALLDAARLRSGKSLTDLAAPLMEALVRGELHECLKDAVIIERKRKTKNEKES